MGASNIDEPLATKAREAVVAELQRQAAEDPERLQIRKTDDRYWVEGEIDIDSLVMIVVGAAAGGP